MASNAAARAEFFMRVVDELWEADAPSRAVWFGMELAFIAPEWARAILDASAFDDRERAARARVAEIMREWIAAQPIIEEEEE